MRSIMRRLETKVFLIVISTTVATLLTISWIARSAYYDGMLEAVRERTAYVNDYAQRVLLPSSFASFENKDAHALVEYARQQKILNDIRKIAGVRHLFTIKRNDAGQIVYVVDGLDLEPPDGKASGTENFHSVGDRVEEEILPQVNKCLRGQVVEADSMLETSFGPVFLTCQPLFEGDKKVAGAIVMEFDARKLDGIARATTWNSMGLSLFVGVFFVGVAVWALRRAYEPFYKRMAYMDYVTDLNNRQSFEQELSRLEQTPDLLPVTTIIVYDINNLKDVNDEMGIGSGDKVLKRMATVLTKWHPAPAMNFRLGGDEFATIVYGGDVEALGMRMKQCFHETQCKDSNFSFSYGFATYDPAQDRNLHDLLHRADIEMYAFKARCRAEGD